MRTKAKVAIASVFAVVIFQLWTFTQVPDAEVFFGEPRVPDVRVTGYGPEDVRQLLVELGEKGRAMYMRAQIKVDLAIPALGALMFFTGIWALAEDVRLVGGRRLSSRSAMAVAAIGLIGPVLDYIENWLVRGMMAAGPDAFDPGTAGLASTATVLKFSFNGIALVLVIVLGLMRWRQR